MWRSTSSTAQNTAQRTNPSTLIQMVSERSGGGKWSGEKVMASYPWWMMQNLSVVEASLCQSGCAIPAAAMPARGQKVRHVLWPSQPVASDWDRHRQCHVFLIFSFIREAGQLARGSRVFEAHYQTAITESKWKQIRHSLEHSGEMKTFHSWDTLTTNLHAWTKLRDRPGLRTSVHGCQSAIKTR